MMLYEKDEGPIPDRVSNIRRFTKIFKIYQEKKVGDTTFINAGPLHNPENLKKKNSQKNEIPLKLSDSHPCHLLAW